MFFFLLQVLHTRLPTYEHSHQNRNATAMNSHYEINLRELSMIGNHRCRDVVQSISFRKIKGPINICDRFQIKDRYENWLYKDACL